MGMRNSLEEKKEGEIEFVGRNWGECEKLVILKRLEVRGEKRGRN